MYNIAIIDDSPELLTELSSYFNGSKKIKCVLAVSSVADFSKYHRDFLDIKLVLLDIILNEKSGIDGIPIILNRMKEGKVVILSILDDKEAIFQALSYGASGYLVKGINLGELETSLISALEDNEYPLSNEVTRHLVEYFHLPVEVNTELSQQEFSISRMLADGMTYQSVADLILISINGVRYHVKNIYRKLNINNRQELKRLINKNNTLD
ncbi:response regulator transcription factor [Haliscomenobacter sp.]|uniref:response regulator transcription factor n=1 Tax=Haliscomenobacter sp. TaxID=2717303 RepID=UPI00336526C0